MEGLHKSEALTDQRESAEILEAIEVAREAADAVRALENGTYKNKADVAEIIASYEESIEGFDNATLQNEGLVVFPGSSTLQ